MQQNFRTPTVYSSETRSSEGILNILISTYKEVLSMKWQIWIAFKKGFVASYRNTLLGIFWAIFLPLIPVSVYLILAQIKILRSSDDMPFVLFIVLGMVIYLFITGTITSVMNSLDKEKAILKKVNYPISAAMLSNFGKVAFELLVRLFFVIPLLIYFGVPWQSGLLLLPLMLVILTVFSLGIGVTLAISNVVLPDIKNVVGLVVAYGLFVSSVIFPMPENGLIGKINLFNPLNTFVNAVRQLIVFGKIENVLQVSIWAAISVVIALFACKLSYSMEYRIKEYL